MRILQCGLISLDILPKFFNILAGYCQPCRRGSHACITLTIPPLFRILPLSILQSYQENNVMKSVRYALCFSSLFLASIAWAQTGKLAGKVIDARTGEPIVGANVVVEGTTYGAASNPDGFFTIVSVPPGTFRVQASVIGYAPATQIDVRVNINQTTNLGSGCPNRPSRLRRS